MFTILLNTLAFIIFPSLLYVQCQETNTNHTIVELNKDYNGTLEADYSYAFYKLIIPEGVNPNLHNLVFKVKEPEKSYNGLDDFSDPDIYVSTTNQFPKNPYQSQYYSEKYGEDLLSIPNKNVFSGQVFYFSIFCEKKCSYEFTARLETEWIIKNNELYSFYLTKDNSISLKFEQKRTSFEELEFIAYSPKMSAFRMYISQDSTPSSSNTMTIVPSWVGGYFSSVSKNSAFYCTNCTFNILIEAENDFAEVFLTVKYEDAVSRVNPQEPIFSALKPFRRHCYFIDVEEKYKNEEIIVQTMLFSGSANLLINPWVHPQNITKFKISKEINSEDVSIIRPADRETGSNQTTGPVYICLKSYDYTSYLMKIFFASQTENLQKFNFLFSGVSVNSYLPAEAVTRHRVTEFTFDSEIFFKMQVYSGNPQFYGYVCEDARKCFFTKESLSLLAQNLTKAEKTAEGYKIIIPNSQNFCHSKLNKEDSLKNEVANLPCAVFAIAYCQGTQPCSYAIQTTHTNSVTKLRERKPHYQLVAYNDTDLYKIRVQNEKVENITIILNSISGDADIQVEGLNNTYKSASYNEGYSPDVIFISKSHLSQGQQLKGDYLIKVKGATFASYSILYYTHESADSGTGSDTDKDKDQNKKPVTANIIQLETGQVIRDFVMEFRNNTNYKVYSYNPKILPSQNGMDIRISLTPEHSEYKIYVLFDIENMKINITAEAWDIVENYIWVSNYSNEIIIKKDDPHYQKDKNYYIVIVPRYTFNNFENQTNTDSNNQNNNNNNISVLPNSFYYLGATNEIYPFILQEGFPSIISLDANYTSQSFWYYHYNISNPVAISLNLFYGRVDIFVDFKWHEDISKSPSAVKILDTDSTYFTIQPQKLKENSGNFPSIPLYVLVRKSSVMDAQFLLSIKSKINEPEQLKPGLVRQDSLLSGEYKYFFLTLRSSASGLLNVNFRYGYGNVYFNVYDALDYKNKYRYPNVTEHEYKANDNYFGKSFTFGNEILSKCSSGSCKVLISIQGTNLGYSEDKIEYTISYYQDALVINQNQPYKGEISEGEMRFFRVYFPKKTQNAYISLTNMGAGDADLYVNYGDDLPSMNKFVWASASPNSEFVEFNVNDNYFVSNNKTDISGNYTIMVYGFSKSVYTLYITAHERKIIALEENSAASCFTSKDNEYCFFRFDDLYQSYWDEDGFGANDGDSISINSKKDLNMIFNSEFIYGSGIIYAKLYDGTDYDILRDFPNEHVYDYSNVNSNIRNFLLLNIKADNPKFNVNSTILITVKCVEKCFFDISATKQYDSAIKYLDVSRENIFYIAKAENKKNLLIYYNNKQGDLDVFAKALEGKANIRVYSNNTIYNSASKEYNYAIKDLASFESAYPERENVHRTISYQNLTLYDNLFFEVNAFSDYTFALRLTYKHDWNKIKLGTPNYFKIENAGKRFYGYFHMHDLYENVQLSISLNRKDLNAYVYVKFSLYDKDMEKRGAKSVSGFDEVPTENNNDFSANTINLMNLATVRLPKLDNDKLINKNTKKLVKVLFSVFIFNAPWEDDNNKQDNPISDHTKDSKDIELKILATPEVNNISKSAIPQKTLFYSLLNGFEKSNNATVQIYDLKRRHPEDDTLIVEISSCKGTVDMVMSKKILNNIRDADDSRMIPSNLENSNGRMVYKFSNLNADNFYMMLRGRKEPDFDCNPVRKDKQNVYNSCNSTFTNVLVYYYTMKSSDASRETVVPRESILYEVVGSDVVKLKWTPLMDYVQAENGNNGNISPENFKLMNATYKIFISNSVRDYIYMDSVCYLNHMNSTNLNWEIYPNTREAKIYGIVPNRKYFINILGKKGDDSDFIAYKSIEVILERSGPTKFTIILITVAIVILVVLVWYFYRKYKVTKQILNYEINDVRNLSNIPKSEAEMREISNKAGKRYQNLTEDTSAV